MIVNMPVKALNERCIECPRLDIIMDQVLFSEEARNTLSCDHWRECTRAYNAGLEDGRIKNIAISEER